MEALARLNALTPKTNPLVMDPNHVNLSLLPRRKEQNKNAKEENKGITFNPTITDKNELADCFRIFTDPEKISRSPAQCLERNQHVRHNKITVHTNGTCFNNGKANAACRVGIWFGNNDPQNQAIRVPEDNQSNQVGEIKAVITAIQTPPHFSTLEIISDSKYSKGSPHTYQTGRTAVGLM